MQSKLRDAIRLALGTKMSNRAIGREIGIAFNTVRRHRITAKVNSYVLDDLMKLDDDALNQCFNSVPTRHDSKRLPDWTYINTEMQRPHMTLQLLWEEYAKSDPDTAYKYSQFTHYFREWQKRHKLSMPQQHTPGERGWVDFAGPTVDWVDPATGTDHHAQIFVAAVGMSHYLFGYAVPAQSTECWIDAHNRWFEYLGGVPKITVTDNLKAGVIRAGSEPVLNTTYKELGRHFGTVILTTRVRKPKDKAKAEGGVLIIERWALARLRNRVFHSIAEINEALRECLELINNRVMRVYGESRRARFEKIDRPHLLELPGTKFEYGEWFPEVLVGNDYHIRVKGHRYSVPYKLVGEKVMARATVGVVEFYHRREVVAGHVRSFEVGGTSTKLNHQPDSHRAWSQQSPEHYQGWAKLIGTNALAIIDHHLDRAPHPALAMKSFGNLKNLAKRYGDARFEAACAEALRIKSPTCKSIRSLLQNRLEKRDSAGQSSTSSMPQHTNVRGAEYYRNQEQNHAD